MEYTKRYTAAFMYVLSTPFSVKMVHQDSNFSSVNNKQVVNILQSPFSHGELARQEKGNQVKLLFVTTATIEDYNARRVASQRGVIYGDKDPNL